MMSASPSRRRPRRETRSAAPGPAPTRWDEAGFWGVVVQFGAEGLFGGGRRHRPVRGRGCGRKRCVRGRGGAGSRPAGGRGFPTGGGAARAARRPQPGATAASMVWRSMRARMGAAPPVLMAMVMGARSMMLGVMKELRSGRSTMLTGMPRALGFGRERAEFGLGRAGAGGQRAAGQGLGGRRFGCAR